MEFTEENIEKAVTQFYQDASCQQEINRWLMGAQLSPQAWNYPWALMAPDKRPEVQFFAASSLHIKISRFWSEMKAERIEELRSQLLQRVVHFAATGPKMVLTRLCVALSSLVLQTTPDLWPNAIQSLIETCQQQNLQLQATQACLLLLEILTVLPEELSTAHLPNHRIGVIRNELTKGVPHVLRVLIGLLSGLDTPPAIQQQTLRCLSAWVQLGVPLPEVEALAVRALQLLDKQDCFDTAVDTLIHVFQHYDNHRYPQSVSRLLPNVLSLQPLWQTACQQHDMEQMQGLTKLLVTVADSNTKLLLQFAQGSELDRNTALALVAMVLQCTSVEGHFPVDECCSDLAFGFWYNLQDELVASERDAYIALTPIFTPVFMALVNALLRKVQYPEDAEFDAWDADEKDSYRCYRQDIADTLMYAYAFLHQPLLGSLCTLLSQLVQRSAVQPVRWQELEAVLFAVASVSDIVEGGENIYLPSLFSSLGQVPMNHKKLISCALSLIGAYAEWISGHSQVLGSVLPLLLRGLLTDPQLAQPATLALRDVLRENQAHVRPFVPQILDAGRQAIQDAQIKSRDVHRLMACLGYALSVLTNDEIMEYLNLLLAPYISRLRELHDTQKASDKIVVQHVINMLLWLFGTLNVHPEQDEEDMSPSQTQRQQPTGLVLQQLMPVFQQTLATWRGDAAIIECTCDMFKSAIRTLLLQISPLFSPLSELLQQLYPHHPHPALLDLAKQLLILFARAHSTQDGANERHAVESHKLFTCLCGHTLSMFESGVIRQQPDILEAFMSFLAQIAKKNNALLVGTGVSHAGLFHAGIVGLAMPEAPASKSACQFLVELIELSGRVPSVHDTVRNVGHTLVNTIFLAMSGESPRACVDNMADVLLALNVHHCEALAQWLHSLAARPSFPSDRATTQSKQVFAKRVLKERSTKRRMKEAVQEYTLLWRGLLHTEYGAQTTST